MKTLSRLAILLGATALTVPAVAGTVSVYQSKPDDPAAITVAGVGDGKADDSAAIQTAIDKAAKPFSGGIVFLPSGRYRITRSIILPPAVRLMGVGPTRPVILLADNTLGFQQGLSEMVVFSGGDQYQVGKIPVPLPNIVPREKPVRDANSGTFYTAMANIDFEMGKGNPSAIGVRMHVAQHGFLRHMEFRSGSGFAGVYMVGNEAEDLHFVGGRYGIVTEKTSPAWQFTLIDSLFEGQRDAAIREHEPQLTLLNVTFRNVPVGVEIDEGYGDQLYGKDVRFENVTKAGMIISNENNVYTQVSFDNALLSGTPVFARFRESGRTLGQAKGAYRVSEFTYGLHLSEVGAMGSYATRYKAEPLAKLPAARARAIPALPGTDKWVDVRSLGVKGDGKADDTAALQAAIDAHPVLYLPTGFYLITDTLKLKPDTVLIGMHPGLTTITLPDNAPAFAGAGSYKAMIEAPKGGRNMLTSLGIFTGRVNPRAGNILWKAGEESLLDDIKVQGGGGTLNYDGKGLDTLARSGGDPVMNMHYDETRPSILVTDGGGGTFSAIWSPNTFASSGFYVSDTATPGHVYQLSNEHHVRNEIILDNVQNWEFLSPQTEQEVGEQGDAISLEIRNSGNLTFANYHGYRVTRNFKPNVSAVKLYNSGGIRFRNVHVNAESGYAYCDDEGCSTYLRASKFPFENAVTDMTRNIEVREREFAVLDIPVQVGPAALKTAPAFNPPAGVFAPGAKLNKLADGFWSISGAATDDAGKLYFVEHRFQRIYSWTGDKGLGIVQDAPLDPVNVAVDRSGNLLVLSKLGPKASVYSVSPKPGEGQITMLSPQPGPVPAGARLLFPSNLWVNGEFRDQYNPATDHFTTLAELFAKDMATPLAEHYVSPDGSVALPAFHPIQQGPPNHQGWRFSHSLDAYGFVTAKAGQRIFVTNESENKTYSGILGADGTLKDLKVFANRGGESVAVDAQGRVFVANGQVFIYAPDGKELGRVDMPERPLQLVFGGPDKRTLFVLTHHALYSIAP
ncbi:MAG TPA: glycosyl hydrolase family 28-related protein [Sphingobium sp.]